MKRVYLLFMTIFLGGFVCSQGTMPIGQAQLNMGVGLSEYGTPIYVGIDFGAIRNVSIGGEMSFRSYNEYWDQFYYRRNIIGISANAKDIVFTQGFSIGLSYFFKNFYSLTGNYSWNKLDLRGSTDPIIPAFNTPEHKFNIGISGRDIDRYVGPVHLVNWSFSVNYKWIQGFTFEGSPQFTGYVPTYDMFDAQVSKSLPNINTTFKLGASNLFNKKSLQVYGGPYVGRLAYFSVTYDLAKNK